MKFLSPEEAVSDVVSQVIILGITVIGVGMITLYGVPEIFELQDMANLKNIEQTFTILDSRASMAILGGSPLQITNVNLGGGAIMVEPNSSASRSFITINSSNFSITIPMGKIKYQLGDRIIAYEGGGLWSKYPSGSVMLSPPEFYYDGITLTLPVINISGNASVGGKGTAIVSIKKTATIVQYPNKSIANRTNPINYNIAGKVYVNITSDYFYDAWYNYARTLPYAKVNRSSTTTSVEFTVAPVTLERNSSIVNPIGFRWLDPGDATPLENFSFKIKPFTNELKWDIRAASGNKKLVFYLKDEDNWVINKKVTLRIGYQEDVGAGTVEAWEGYELYTIQPDYYIYVDLLSSLDLTYKKENVGFDGATCQPFPNRIDKNFFSDKGFSWVGETLIEDSTKKSLYDITQHYIRKIEQEGDICFNHCGESDKTPDTTSSMLINYTGKLSYLHITENRADVGIS